MTRLRMIEHWKDWGEPLLVFLVLPIVLSCLVAECLLASRLVSDSAISWGMGVGVIGVWVGLLGVYLDHRTRPDLLPTAGDPIPVDGGEGQGTPHCTFVTVRVINRPTEGFVSWFRERRTAWGCCARMSFAPVDQDTPQEMPEPFGADWSHIDEPAPSLWPLQLEAFQATVTRLSQPPGQTLQLYIPRRCGAVTALPSRQQPQRRKQADILPGTEGCNFAIALKHEGEAECYGFNAENYRYAGWRHPARALAPGAYSVQIELTWANDEKASSRFVLHNGPGLDGFYLES